MLLVICLTFPLLVAYGWPYFDVPQAGLTAGPADLLSSWTAPAAAVIAFGRLNQGTPGKFALSLRLVDARTRKTLTVGQSIGRNLGDFVSLLPRGLGLIWVTFDPKMQGWHDKLASTAVVRNKPVATVPVRFKSK